MESQHSGKSVPLYDMRETVKSSRLLGVSGSEEQNYLNYPHRKKKLPLLAHNFLPLIALYGRKRKSRENEI